MFAKFDKNHQKKIFVANGQHVAVKEITGAAQIYIVNTDDKRRSIKIQDILYVPLINGNLLSVRKLVIM